MQAAKGWHQPGADGLSVKLGHSLHDVEALPEDDRARFTVSPAARKELLARLRKRNHLRATGASTAPSTAAGPELPKVISKDDKRLFADMLTNNPR